MLADLESKAIKAGMMYTEIETKKGIVFKGKSLCMPMMESCFFDIRLYREPRENRRPGHTYKT